MMEEIISTFSLPGNVVLVPFLGSGVSLRASYSLGLSCFGWDADPQYKDRFMIAVEQDVKDMDTEAVEGI
jgi:DNA modification methylase